MLVGFGIVIALSIALALLSRRGHAAPDARAFFAASGQFGAALVFLLAVGETYSVASMLGFPGGVYAHGDGFSAWFFGYILLTAPVLFFAGPLIARAGKLYGAATIADFFGRHFESRAFERVVALAAILALLPVGTMQFVGLKIVLATLVPGQPTVVLALFAACLVFGYVAIAGLRASAYVAALKDLLMLGSILLVSGVALATWRQGLSPAAQVIVPPLGGREMSFAATTIVVQAAGYALLPQTWTFLFAARSADAIRRAQVAAPLYMVMFPLLTVIASYALLHGLKPPTPDHVFLVTAAALLPAWLVGIVLAGVMLAGLVLLTTVCLAIGSLITRNLLSGLESDRQQRWAKGVTALYLLVSIGFAEASAQLMATLNNMTYFGIIQLLPALIVALWVRRASAGALIVGIIAGDVCAAAIFATKLNVGGINPGLIGLVVNALLVAILARFGPSGAMPVFAKLARE